MAQTTCRITCKFLGFQSGAAPSTTTPTEYIPPSFSYCQYLAFILSCFSSFPFVFLLWKLFLSKAVELLHSAVTTLNSQRLFLGPIFYQRPELIMVMLKSKNTFLEQNVNSTWYLTLTGHDNVLVFSFAKRTNNVTQAGTSKSLMFHASPQSSV